MALGDFPQDHPGRGEIGISHHLGRGQPQRGELQQNEGGGAGKDRQVEQPDPDDRWQRPPLRRADVGPAEQNQHHEARQQHAEGEHHRRFAPIQPPDHGRIGGVGDAADEIDHLALADVKRLGRLPVAVEDHPERTARPHRQRGGHAAGGDLSEQPVAEQRREDRGQGEDRRGADRPGRLQPLEHQHEIGGEEPAQHQVPPGRDEGGAADLAGGRRDDADHHRGDGKPRRVEGGRGNLVRHLRAEREGSRHQRRKGQHRQMSLRPRAEPGAGCGPCIAHLHHSCDRSLRWRRKLCTLLVRCRSTWVTSQSAPDQSSCGGITWTRSG